MCCHTNAWPPCRQESITEESSTEESICQWSHGTEVENELVGGYCSPNYYATYAKSTTPDQQ